MSKKTGIIIGSIALAIVVLSVSTILYFRTVNAESIAAAPLDEFYIPTIEEEREQKNKESSSPISVPPIVAPTKKVAQVIEEPTAGKPEDDVPPPSVSETADQDGGVIQTPNWEAQKQLAADTDLEDPDKQPEYVKPEQSQSTASSKPAAPASSSSSASSKTSTSSSSSSSKADAGSSSIASSKQSGNTPKNGDTKVINGETYGYIEGFGWVKKGSGNVQTEEHFELSGEKVGY